jgi:hypothetical protein
MEAVGQLTGGIAHDFNNILTVITGTIEILGDAVKDRPPLVQITNPISAAAAWGADLTSICPPSPAVSRCSRAAPTSTPSSSMKPGCCGRRWANRSKSNPCAPPNLNQLGLSLVLFLFRAARTNRSKPLLRKAI